jgi:hypothetical protein
MALLAIDGHFPLFASFIPSLSLSLSLSLLKHGNLLAGAWDRMAPYVA